jgi:hypothetical protein
MAPSQTAFIDVYTAPQNANVNALVTNAVRRHGLASGGTHPVVSSKRTTVAGQPAVAITVHYPGAFDNFEKGEIRYSIAVLTRKGVTYVFAFSSVDPWATQDAPKFAAFLRSLRFT